MCVCSQVYIDLFHLCELSDLSFLPWIPSTMPPSMPPAMPTLPLWTLEL